MTRRMMTAMALTLMLSACGDDGKDMKTSATASGKTAARTPTPSPSASPARTYTYDKIDFKADRSFIGYDRVSGTAKGEQPTSAELSSSETAVTSYTTATGKITLADSADLANAGVFEAKGGAAPNGRTVSWSAGDIKVEIGQPDDLTGYDYFAYATYNDTKIYRAFLIGYPTNPAELTGAAARTYLAVINEQENDKNGVKPQSLTLDFAKNTVSGTVPWVDDNKSIGDYDLLGKIDSNKHLTGLIRSKSGKITGEFSGRLFGSGGKELALLVSQKKEDGSVEVKPLTGKLQ